MDKKNKKIEENTVTEENAVDKIIEQAIIKEPCSNCLTKKEIKRMEKMCIDQGEILKAMQFQAKNEDPKKIPKNFTEGLKICSKNLISVWEILKRVNF